MKSDRVPVLRSRLKVTGDMPAPVDSASDLFDEAVEEAVKRFQLRHGLFDDGIVGTRTLRALNVPVERRIRQIELNLERWRWLPQNLGNPYILVNIAGYGLEVVENEAPVLTMKIVVGTAFQKTPVFSGKMTYIEMNPYWNVPHSIATEETLEKIRKNPDFFAKENMRVFTAGQNGEEVSPAAIDWSQLSENNFPYRLRQEPGPRNPLGRIKFMFPNKHSVYLHDTSDPQLFRKERRGFSHGCIRIEKPMDMAEFVMRGSKEWSIGKIEAVLKTKETTVAYLPKPIPVHILYFTAWGNGDGTIHFLEDIYRRDERLEKALPAKNKACQGRKALAGRFIHLLLSRNPIPESRYPRPSGRSGLLAFAFFFLFLAILPRADITHIEVDEPAPCVVPDAAAAHFQGRIADVLDMQIGHPQIDGHPGHVQAVSGNLAVSLAQDRIGPG